MAKESIRSRTFKGTIWSGVQQAGTIFLSFVSGIILARLLTPADYGCIGMLTIFLIVSNTFIDGGLGSALIQKKDPKNCDYSTVFFWNLVLSAGLYILLFFSAPAIARFYNQEILCDVLRVMGLVLIINAVKIVPFNRLKKNLFFNKIAIIEVTSSLASLGLTIFLAYRGAGVWSLVFQQIFMSFFSACAYWAIGNWRPSWSFSKESFRELFSFGGFILLSNLINNFCNNIEGLLIGKFYSPATMGYYSKAKSTESVSSSFLSQVVEQVAYPVLSEIQNDREQFIDILRKIICSLAYITFPIMLLLVVLAKPIFILLYTDKWLDSVPYFQILCFAGLAICLQGINYYAVAAMGKSKDLFKWTIVKRGLGLVFIFCGIILCGMRGLLVGIVMTAWTIYLINAYLVAGHVGYSILAQLRDLAPVAGITAVAFFITYASGQIIVANMYFVAAVQLVLFVATYILLSYIFKLNSFVYFRSLLYPYVRRFIRKG